MKKLFTQEDLERAFNLGKEQGYIEAQSNREHNRHNEFSSEFSSEIPNYYNLRDYTSAKIDDKK
ncbi:MAG: hypothetical protein KID00_00130 [Clostridium argentinense]|uniref:Uncharacterized protein n=1 Tax=Clostridium faecium TaxID=2762223 RepID=A0ABR8YQN2_9CLOT|nr:MULTISPECIES: hypothetical protein [Clostridium]MBD8046209.1 hypothetical protein [Clostridium faecium]MBS5822261.1 hypothetical protein [Clostridium argentinense]MDU1348562.1 hypothetical protein [Clostridium argentinense]